MPASKTSLPREERPLATSLTIEHCHDDFLFGLIARIPSVGGKASTRFVAAPWPQCSWHSLSPPTVHDSAVPSSAVRPWILCLSPSTSSPPAFANHRTSAAVPSTSFCPSSSCQCGPTPAFFIIIIQQTTRRRPPRVIERWHVVAEDRGEVRIHRLEVPGATGGYVPARTTTDTLMFCSVPRRAPGGRTPGGLTSWKPGSGRRAAFKTTTQT